MYRGRYNPDVEVTELAGTVEIVKDGNVAGDNDNWRFTVVGNNLVKQVKVLGTWQNAEETERPV